MHCPKCHLVNPEGAYRCDCGHRFCSDLRGGRITDFHKESSSGWYPTRKQWFVIWPTVLTAAVSLLLEFPIGAAVAFMLGGLLIWQLSSTSRSKLPMEKGVSIYCGECGAGINFDWEFCPKCGAPNWKRSP